MFFRNKAMQVTMVKDPKKETVFIPTRPVDYDKINVIVKDQIITVGLVVAGVFVAKNLSAGLGSAIRETAYRFSLPN